MSTPPVARGKFSRTCDVCGWSGVYATAGIADAALRRHSCERRKALLAKQARGRAWLAAVDRTPKICKHPKANHQHGDYAMYVHDGCRCTPCAAAQSEYEKVRLRNKAYGRPGNFVDAAPIRAHVAQLNAAGMGRRPIIEKAGIARSTYLHLTAGTRGRPPARRIRRDIADRILAVRAEVRPGALVPAAGTTLRLRALVALGWSQAELARRLGVTPSNASALFHGPRQVTKRRADQVSRLYETLSMRLPPTNTPAQRASVTKAQAHATRNGWLPPLALDDERLDDPDYRPRKPSKATVHYDEAVVERFVTYGEKTGLLRKAETDEIIRRLLARGLSTAQIEDMGLNYTRYLHRQENASNG